MPIRRQDAWSREEDIRLAEIVLRHIREGSTQLAGFTEAGNALSRTPAACGFRWNSTVRKMNASAVQQAKKARAERKKTTNRQRQHEANETKQMEKDAVDRPDAADEQCDIDQVIHFLKRLKTRAVPVSTDTSAAERIKSLEAENQFLDDLYQKLRKEYTRIKYNYDSLVHLFHTIDRARQKIMPLSEPPGNEKAVNPSGADRLE